MDLIPQSATQNSLNFHHSLENSARSMAISFDIQEKVQINFIVIQNLIKKLNQEVRDKLRHPQWKHFKHMEICDSDRIRISNIIWRSWHIKFQHNYDDLPRNTPFLDFSIPDLDTAHKHSKSIVLEGQYWCRKNVRVALEYANWRQEFMRRVKRTRNVSNQTSNNSVCQSMTHSQSESHSLFFNTRNDPEFPIFTQREIDDLVMLDMHDTLFTSNPLHVYTSSHSSEEHFPPQSYCLPSLGYHNFQPALDHLHPFYQGYFDDPNVLEHDISRSANSFQSFSNSSSKSNSNSDLLFQFPHTDTMQARGNTELLFTNEAQLCSHKFNSISKHSNESTKWSTDLLSQRINPSLKFPSDAGFQMLGDTIISPSEKQSSDYSLEHGFDSSHMVTGHRFDLQPDLHGVVESLNLRILQLEEQVAVQQRILQPLLNVSPPQKNGTVADSEGDLSPPPLAKRFCSHQNIDTQSSGKMRFPFDISESKFEFSTPVSISFSPLSQPQNLTSGGRGKFGIKSLLEELEVTLAKQNLNGPKLSNASLLLRAADFATNLKLQVNVKEKEFTDLQSRILGKSNTSANSLIQRNEKVGKCSLRVDQMMDQFGEYLQQRSIKDPKYYIFSKLVAPLFEQYIQTYSPGSKQEFFVYLKEFCFKSFNATRMRSEISSVFSQLCKETQFLTKPELLVSDIASTYTEK